MKTIFLFTLLLGYANIFAQYDQCAVIGWATQNGSTTGGGTATAVTVSNYTDFKSKLEDNTTKVVYVSGTITIPAGGRVNMKNISGKTIIGLSGSKMISTDMTASGSGILYVSSCTNLIFRNLYFEGPGAYDTDGYDNICFDNCQNVWVDHCEFHDGMDGNLDIKNASNYISVTWCTFSYEKPPKAGGPGGADDHRYTSLFGASDGATQDDGKLCITMAFCWWGEGCRERMPRVRFGKIHLINNLFTSSVSNHCIRAGYKANILAEGNYFDNQKLPIDEYNKDYTAILGRNNYGAAAITQGTIFTPPYTLTVYAASDIVTPIKTYAGAKMPSPTTCPSSNQPPVVTLTAPTNNASYTVGSTVTFTATATDSDGISKIEFYSGTTLLGTATTSPYSISWKSTTGVHSITAKAYDSKSVSSSSAAISITVTDPNIATLVGTNTTQGVTPNSAIAPMTFTWGGAATDVSYTTLPAGLTASKNSTTKTLTISGTPTAAGSFSVSSIGGTSAITVNASVTISCNQVLANWYTFQESSISLPFVSFTSAKINTSYDASAYTATGCTNGALQLTKGVGTLTLTLKSLQALKIRWAATGGRTMQVTYGATGTETTWTSASQYSSGSYEHNLTSLIPGLASNSPIIVNIINNRDDGGTMSITDLYVEGAYLDCGVTKQSITLKAGWNLLSFNVTPSDNTITSLFNGLDVLEIKTMDAFWKKGQASAFNGLQALTAGAGYLVNMNIAGTLTVLGTAIVNPQIETLSNSSWNLIGYPYQSNTAFSNLFNSSNCSAIKNFDGFWIPNGSNNSLTNLETGKGYFIKK